MIQTVHMPRELTIRSKSSLVGGLSCEAHGQKDADRASSVGTRLKDWNSRCGRGAAWSARCLSGR